MINGFYIPRRDIFLEKELRHGETGNAKFLRLVRNGKGRWQRPVHEVLTVEGETKKLTSPLLHYSHKNFSGFIAKINYYTDINSKYLFGNGVKTSLPAIFFYPLAKFILNYILKKGFMDGTPGFLHAMGMSFHSFLTRGKIWQLQHGVIP